jgi:hypothetical protein
MLHISTRKGSGLPKGRVAYLGGKDAQVEFPTRISCEWQNEKNLLNELSINQQNSMGHIRSKYCRFFRSVIIDQVFF